MKKEEVTTVTNVTTETPNETPSEIKAGNSYFNFREPEPAQKLERRPPLEYRASEIELEEVVSGVPSAQIPTQEQHETYMTFSEPKKSSWRLATACLWAFSQGFSDGAPGVLLPYMETQYHISYSVVSMIWVCNAAGVILVAAFAHKLLVVLGLRKLLCFACLMGVLMQSLVSSGTAFPAICVAFFFGGVGNSIAAAQFNIFSARFEKASQALGYFHGSYGLGASVSPLIATAFMSQGYKWYNFYPVIIALMALTFAAVFFTFKGADEDIAALGANVEKVETVKKDNLLLLVLRDKATWLMSLFVLFYQGAEVAIGAWVVTYIRDYRGNTSTSVGYVASGYWFGLTLGRLVVTRAMHGTVGPRYGNIILLVLSILFVGLTWAIPSTIGEGVCVALAGVAIGPIYPLMITMVLRVLPRKTQVVSLTFASAFGCSGGALFPFLIGLVSQYAGAFVVLPAFIILFLMTLVMWVCLSQIWGDAKRYLRVLLHQCGLTTST